MADASPRILAIIPARGGSKRLPGKNLRPLAGRPLLAYSIMTARACGQIESVVVSSEDSATLQVAHAWGADGIRRPAALADDWVPTITAMQHALETVCLTGWEPSHVALFQATCPLRRVAEIEKAIDQYLTSGADSALSVNELHLKAGRHNGDGWYQPQYPVGIRKQDLEPIYQENGALYLARADLVAGGTLLGSRTLMLRLSPEAGLASIDTEFDFLLTEALYRQLDFEAEFSRLIPSRAANAA